MEKLQIESLEKNLIRNNTLLEQISLKLNKILIQQETAANLTDIIGIDEVEKLTGLEKSTIRGYAKSKMPCVKRGKPLKFSRKAIVEWNNERLGL